MVGRSIQNKYPKERAPHGNRVLSVAPSRSQRRLHDISFRPQGCEVLGSSPGWSARDATETARRVTARILHDAASSSYSGKAGSIRRPLDSNQRGNAFLTEEPQMSRGLILIQSVAFNTAIVQMQKYARTAG